MPSKKALNDAAIKLITRAIGDHLLERAATKEPPPIPDPRGIDVLPYVLDSLDKRADFGYEKYGTRLKTFNGRDALMDAYQEVLDAAVYLAQAILERDYNERNNK